MPLLPALASAVVQSCEPNTTACKADAVLHWLYIAAGVLAVVLTLVVVLAVQVWRKNRSGTPHE